MATGGYLAGLSSGDGGAETPPSEARNRLTSGCARVLTSHRLHGATFRRTALTQLLLHVR